MSKNSRRSTCQRVSDGTDGAHPWRYRKVPAEQIALATSRAVHIRLLCIDSMKPLVSDKGSAEFFEPRRWSRIKGRSMEMLYKARETEDRLADTAIFPWLNHPGPNLPL